tara:strand:+ start:1560 stop:1733 length:174 start_codon:yes stop_codon:yes gene_type:complete
MKYIDYLKHVIKLMAYDNIILFPMDKVVNSDIEHFEKQVKPLKEKSKEKNEKDKDTV